MNIKEIKKAVDEGQKVCWSNPAYDVIKDDIGQYLIKCNLNGHCIGLHGLKGTKYENQLNGKEEDFYMPDPRWLTKKGEKR